MTVKDAVAKCLNDWASGPGFCLNGAQFQVECFVQDAIDEWAEAHGWKFDEDQCLWQKETKQ